MTHSDVELLSITDTFAQDWKVSFWTDGQYVLRLNVPIYSTNTIVDESNQFIQVQRIMLPSLWAEKAYPRFELEKVCQFKSTCFQKIEVAQLLSLSSLLITLVYE